MYVCVCLCVFVAQNPELVKRLEKIKREQEQKEYDQMVSNIDNSVSQFSAFTYWLCRLVVALG